MPHGFDNTWCTVKDLGLVSFAFFLFLCSFVKCVMSSASSLFSASVRSRITNEQEAFIRRVLDIPFDE